MKAPHSDDWREGAKCAESGSPDLWFDAPKAAVEVCHACPVRTECLEWALDLPALQGVAGGLTEAQRSTVRRKRRRTRLKEEKAA